MGFQPKKEFFGQKGQKNLNFVKFLTKKIKKGLNDNFLFFFDILRSDFFFYQNYLNSL